VAFTLTQTRSFSDPLGYGARLVSFDRFNPALGTLDEVRLGVSAGIGGSVQVESLEAAPATVTTSYSSQVSVFGPTGQILAQNVAATSQTMALAGFDGTADFAGESGAAAAVPTAMFPPTTLSVVTGAADFTGEGTVDLAVSDVVRSRVDGPANMRVLTEGSASGEVSLEYDYTPPLPPNWGWGGVSGSVVNSVGAFVVHMYDFGFSDDGPAPVIATTQTQTFRFDPQTTGWQSQVAAAGFDASLGTLAWVDLRFTVSLAATAAIENHMDAAGAARFWQSAVTTLSLGDTALLQATTGADRWLSYSAADGTDDFAGPGGTGDGGMAATQATAGSVGAWGNLAAFTQGTPVTLSVGSTGTGWMSAPGNFLAEMTAKTSAVLELAYTYYTTAASVLVEDGGAGTKGALAGEAYTGPVSGLQNQFIRITPDNLTIAATSNNWFIRSGDGTDAIAACGGTNVIDGGGGSNYLTGGFGQDTFFVDCRDATGDIWSTMANFGLGDEVTLWGVTPEGFNLSWADDEGAAGAKGLTVHASAPGTPMTSATLAGYSLADLDTGRLVTSFGSSEGVPYLHIQAV